MGLFETFVDECSEKDFHLDENFLARCLICIATRQAFPEKDREDFGGTAPGEAWVLTKKGVQRRRSTSSRMVVLVDSSALHCRRYC